MVSDSSLQRFRADLDALMGSGPIGVAVSGGPDSLALLLLTAAARPGAVEAATVDHQLRPESGAEAGMVAEVCARLNVSHAVLAVSVPAGASLQAQARSARYAALEDWARSRHLHAIATAHHADDQAETLLMRLSRGAGLGGLAGVRASRLLGEVQLIRPLLGWRKRELEAIVADAGLEPLEDPSNQDKRHDRTQARQLLAAVPWLDPALIARSAAHLEDAEEALQAVTTRLAAERLEFADRRCRLDAADLPRELQRRLLLAAITRLDGPTPRGPDLDRALGVLAQGGTCTLSGLKLEGGQTWRLSPAPPRRA
ncbi:tRNA lysidine(34) synthetase TilS [Sphingomonas arenae]|uniref:tRNA lysidine(34) synthetase TilS n=1 Tax=Sphingomonas arenae TaxID=2812555 RepID=UPI0019672A3B|nr:tRNA lysidine(34) synthetase TilS [Sphingomonas arenae]